MTTEAKFTKGPWRLDDGRIYGMEDDEVLICDVAPHDAALTDYDEANAKLIAAAPELLEACQMALEYDDEFGSGQANLAVWAELRDTLQAAIRKATE